MLGGTEIIQDWNLNTVFIASVHPPPRKLYFTWPFICLFLLPHERQLTVHTLSFAVAVWLHQSFCFQVRQYFNCGDYLQGTVELLLTNLISQDSVPDKAGFFIRRFIHSSHLNYLVDVISKYLQTLVQFASNPLSLMLLKKKLIMWSE